MLKSGIKTAHNKSLKRSYKHLNPKEYRIMKLIEKKDQAQNFLYGYFGFFATAPRLENNAVDYEKIEESTLDIVDQALKTIEKFNKIDDDVILRVTTKFCQTQFSYSQSY